MSVLPDVLRMKLETLLGERGPAANAAVRTKDLDAAINRAVKRAAGLSGGDSTVAMETAKRALELAQQALDSVDERADELALLEETRTIREEAEGIMPEVDAKLTGISFNIDEATTEATAAAEAAAVVQGQHNTLVAGFAGDLATAFAEQSARAMATGGGWLKDPTFTDWVSGNLNTANWVSRSGTSAYAVEGGGDFGGGMIVSAPSGSSLVQVVASNAAGGGLVNANAVRGYVVLELDLEYISGDPAGIVFRVEWSNDGTTWTRGTFDGIAESFGNGVAYGLTPAIGTRKSIRALWKRPASASGFIRLVAAFKVSGVTAAQNMVIHYINLRASQPADIDAGETYTIASATPGSVVSYTGAGSAIAGLNAAFSARAGGLEGAVTNILGVRADLLAGTAFGALLTQLAVNAGTGISATVTAQGVAIASLNGNASASYALRVGAGGVGAGLELVAFNNAAGGGAASNVKINADYIDLVGKVRASSLLVSDQTNMVPNGAFDDATAVAEYWYTASNSGARYFLAKTTSASYCQTGSYSLLLQKADTSTSASMASKIKFPVSAGEWLYGETAIKTNEAASTAGAYVRINFFDETDTALSYVDIAANIGTTTSWSKHTKEFQVPVGAVTARAEVFHLASSNSQNLIVDRIIVRRMNGSELTVAGTITGEKLDINSAIIRGPAQIENLIVDTIHIKGNAVTVTPRAIKNTAITINKAPIGSTSGGGAIDLTMNRTAGLVTKVEWSGIISPNTTDDTKFAQVLFYIQRDKGGVITDFFDTYLTSNNKNDTFVSFTIVDTDTSGGTVTYQVGFGNTYHVNNSNCTVIKQVLEATQFKK